MESHEGAADRSNENLVGPVFVILGFGAAAIIATLAYAAWSEDELASRTATSVVGSILAYEHAELGDLAYDLAWWDELIENVYLDFDLEWIEDNLGSYLSDPFDVAAVFAFDGGDRLVIGGIDADPYPAGEPLPISGGLVELATEARQRAGPAPEPVPGILLIEDEAHLAVAVAVVPDDLPRAVLGPGPLPLLLLTRRLDEPLLLRVGRDFHLDGLRWLGADLAAAGRPGSEGRFAIVAVDGTHLGDLAWAQDRPGAGLLASVAPWVIAFVAVMAIPLTIFLRRAQAVSAMLRESSDRFRRLANTDALTGSHSRRYYLDLSRRALADARRHAHPLSLAVLDIDHFKRVNDELGHDAGDELLRHFVQACKENLRQTDFLGRIGGEEFAATLPHTDGAAGLEVMERLRVAIGSAAPVIAGREQPVRVSIGVAELCEADGSLHALMKRADAALYRAKESGRDRVVLAGEEPTS